MSVHILRELNDNKYRSHNIFPFLSLLLLLHYMLSVKQIWRLNYRVLEEPRIEMEKMRKTLLIRVIHASTCESRIPLLRGSCVLLPTPMVVFLGVIRFILMRSFQRRGVRVLIRALICLWCPIPYLFIFLSLSFPWFVCHFFFFSDACWFPPFLFV